MPENKTQESNPPLPGYSTNSPPLKKRKRGNQMKTKGDRGFIEGCIFAVCCCWIWEECCYVD